MDWRLRIAGCAFSIICLMQMMMPCQCAHHLASQSQSCGCSFCGTCDHSENSSCDSCTAGKQSEKPIPPAPCEKCVKRAFVAAHKIEAAAKGLDIAMLATHGADVHLSVEDCWRPPVRQGLLDIVAEVRCTQRMQV